MPNLTESLDSLMELSGAKCAALVDSDSGMVIGQSGSSSNLDIAAAGNTEVIRAQRKLMESLGLNDAIDDILITLTNQYDILRQLSAHPSMFIYLTMDKSKSNLALARFSVAECEGQLVL
jgi:predicted regulator of Ras-like GTPase activity (Roadblock/LC7/MglB family)